MSERKKQKKENDSAHRGRRIPAEKSKTSKVEEKIKSVYLTDSLYEYGLWFIEEGERRKRRGRESPEKGGTN